MGSAKCSREAGCVRDGFFSCVGPGLLHSLRAETWDDAEDVVIRQVSSFGVVCWRLDGAPARTAAAGKSMTAEHGDDAGGSRLS